MKYNHNSPRIKIHRVLQGHHFIISSFPLQPSFFSLKMLWTLESLMAEECHTPKRSRISLGSDLRIRVAFHKGKTPNKRGCVWCVWRYGLLYHHGGIYMDTDFLVVKEWRGVSCNSWRTCRLGWFRWTPSWVSWWPLKIRALESRNHTKTQLVPYQLWPFIGFGWDLELDPFLWLGFLRGCNMAGMSWKMESL